MPSSPRRAARLAAATKSSRTLSMPARSSANGASSPSACGTADGARVFQPSGWSGRIWLPPSQGAWLDALRPACASCIASAIGECALMALITLPSAASFASEYKPRSPGVMRPSGDTADASMISIAAPDSASWPRWIMCQSAAEPSSAEYWHMGAITMRFSSRRLPIERVGTTDYHSWGDSLLSVAPACGGHGMSF